MNWQAIAGHRLVHNSLFLSVNQMLKFISRGFYMLLLAGQLGPEVYGLLSYGQNWYLVYFALSSLGVSQATLHVIGRHAEDPRPTIRTSLGLRLSLASPAWPLCVGVALAVETDERALQILLILSGAVVARSLAAWASGVCVGLELGRPVLLIETAWRLAEVVSGTWLVWNGCRRW